MMKNRLKIIIAVFFLVIVETTKGQELGVDTISTNLNSLPDTINLNDNYVHTIVIQNYNSTPLNGIIYLVGAIDSSGTLISIDTVGSVFVTNFNLNDTVGITYNETYDVPNGYKLGTNIVVVWPVASSGITRDTLRKEVFIDNPISVNPVKANNDDLIIYPNPFNNYIFLKNLGIKNEVRQVRIFDVNGRIVYKEKYNTVITTEQFIKGLYFLEIEFFDNSKKYNKLIKN